MVVDPRPERGIGKEGKQVKFGKGLYGALLPMAMSPTTLRCKLTFNSDDYGKKANIRKTPRKKRKFISLNG